MVKSLYTGVSGMKTHQWRMDVIGNNISNVNTVGFKGDVPVFKDIAYMTKRSPSAATSTLGGINPSQVGYGVGMNSVTANMTQSGYTSSDNVWDMSIVGNGFFQVMDGAGNIYYTRAGNFKVDDDGYITNANGYHVLGTNGNSQGQPADSEILRIVIPDTNAHTSTATKRINNSNVTVTVTSPSNNTDMSVSFQNSTYPYATFSNNILTIFFNTDAQYESKDDFDRAIQQALDAGGINLPDDVQLTVGFDSIPDNTDAIAAHNSVVDGYEFSTTTAMAQLHTAFTPAGSQKDSHAYISFDVADPKNSDIIKINYGGTSGTAEAVYTSGVWTLTLYGNTTRADIKDALESHEATNQAAPKLTLNSFVVPSEANKDDIIKDWSFNTGGTGHGITSGTPEYANGIQLKGAPQRALAGSLDLEVQDAGEFGNTYKVVFSSTSGYDKTNVSWDENTLNITVCANTTISEINSLIKEASRGDSKRIIEFNNISGLRRGGVKSSEVVQLSEASTRNASSGLNYVNRDGNSATIAGAAAAATLAAGSYLVETDFNGIQRWSPINQTTGAADTANAIYINDNDDRVLDTTTAAAAFNMEKPDTGIWTPGICDAFFSGNPSISPKDGADAFFTQVAKSMSTFNLQEGRTGSEQSLDTITDYMIQADGTILGKHSIHGTMVLGRIDLVTFDNPNGLQKVGGTNFAATVASGEAHVKIPTQDGAGEVVAGTLEMSNVDLADEFTNMITTQRGYQANSRVITVSDTMIEELLSLKR